MNTTHTLVTCAWPYANGSLHVGHAAALLPADIIARFYRLSSQEVLFVSGTDSHGTPISVRAEKEGIPPKDIAERYHKEFQDSFSKLGFSFSLYSTTTSKIHQKVVHDIFLALYTAGFIVKKKDSGFYSEKDKRFLPDRFVEGECPYCHDKSARGDQCDACGRLLDPKDLINIKSKISGDTPVEKETEHFYLALSKLQPEIESYIERLHHPRKNTKRFVTNFIREGLHDRAITRDLDWGIPLPAEIGTYPSKRIYVWFEAVCGYLSASKEWAQQNGDKDGWAPFWKENVKSSYVYGKDNIPFHTIIWPAILLAYSKATHQKLNLPSVHVASEYLQIEGRKLSTSKNWAVWIPDLLKDFSQDAIRYSLISSSPELSDTNFSFTEFQTKFNNEFVATIGNYLQRILKLTKDLELTGVNDYSSSDAHEATFREVSSLIEETRYKEALQRILQFGKFVNTELDAHEPWKLKKAEPAAAKTYLASCCYHGAQLGILLEPFLPEAAQKIRKIFGVVDYTWKPYKANLQLSFPEGVLFDKIEDETIQKHISLLSKTST